MAAARALLGLGLLCACGRLDFDAQSPNASAGRCATATFSLPAASTFADDFTTGVLTDRWHPVASCIAQASGELVATPSPTPTSYCHAWTNGDFHLSCDSIVVKVPEVTTETLGVQTFIYVTTHPPSCRRSRCCSRLAASH
jgi:hypothetical protein